jgi:hypothetical protein
VVQAAAGEFRLKFGGFKRLFVDSRKVTTKIQSGARRGLRQVGAILRQEVRKTIKRRIVTQGMQERRKYAYIRGDSRAVQRIESTIAKRRAEVSQPGQPPIAHVPDHPVASIRAIYFASDSRAATVGPVAANQVNYSWIDVRRTTVPKILEFGDRVTIHEWRFTKLRNRSARWDKWISSLGFTFEWKRRDQRWLNVARKRVETLSDLGVQVRSRTAVFRPRPFMNPTLRKNIGLVQRILNSSFAGRDA